MRNALDLIRLAIDAARLSIHPPYVMDRTTKTSGTTLELNSKTLLEAIEAVKNMVPKPRIVEGHVRDLKELEEVIRLVGSDPANLSYLYGFPVRKNSRLNPNEMMLCYDDGTHQIVKIKK